MGEELQDVWEFDFASETWRQLDDLLAPVTQAAAVRFESSSGETKVLLFGGQSEGKTVNQTMILVFGG